MTWQISLADDLSRVLDTDTELDVVGSVRQPSTLDGWSDLDL